MSITKPLALALLISAIGATGTMAGTSQKPEHPRHRIHHVVAQKNDVWKRHHHPALTLRLVQTRKPAKVVFRAWPKHRHVHRIIVKPAKSPA